MTDPVPENPDADPDPAALRTITEITIVSQLAESLVDRVLPNGMTRAQFGVLDHFSRRGGEETPVQLASAFQVTKGAMTNTLQRLEAAGLVRIRPDPGDGRRKLVAITEAGSRAHAAALRRLAPSFAGLLTAIPRAEFEAALPFLGRLRAWFDTHR